MSVVSYRPNLSNTLAPPPYHGAHSRTLSLHDHILQAYLPYFTTHHFRTDPDVDAILDSWLRSNPDLLEPSRYFPGRARDFRSAFVLVLDAAAESENIGEAVSGVSRLLLDQLEAEWEDDLRMGTRRCQRLFRGLAEVSNAAGSWPLGNVLRTFFLGWLRDLAEEEDTACLAGWCWGLSRSYMDLRDKEECLRSIVALRPDVLAELEARGVQWAPAKVVASPLVNWPARRRNAGRLWWDDDMDRRIQRLLEDQEYLDCVADRDRRKLLQLRLRNRSPDRRLRYLPLAYHNRSRGRGLSRSRSPPRAQDLVSDEDRAAGYPWGRPLPRSSSIPASSRRDFERARDLREELRAMRELEHIP